MQKKVKFNFFLKLDLSFYNKLNFIYIKGENGVIFFKLPNYFFYKNINDILSFCFLNKYFFNSFFKQILFFIKIFYKYYFIRLKLKGLGYRIKKYNNDLYRFFMGYNHYFYFFVPVNTYIWNKKRNFLILSIDKIKINDIFNQLLLLKKLDFFERTNSFINPKKILFLKK